MKARLVRLVAAFALLLAFMGIGASGASARTWNDGLSIWASDKTLSAGDEVRGDVTVTFDGNVRTYFGDFEQLNGCRVGGRVINAFGDGDDLGVFSLPSVDVPDALSENRKIFSNLAWDAVVVLIFLLFPLRVRVALERVEKHPGLSALAGAVALVAVLPIAIMLLLSIIGIPLIPLEIAALFAGFWIAAAVG